MKRGHGRIHCAAAISAFLSGYVPEDEGLYDVSHVYQASVLT